jgi:hypothetical protein
MGCKGNDYFFNPTNIFILLMNKYCKFHSFLYSYHLFITDM